MHLCVTVQDLHYIFGEYQITVEARLHKRNLLRGGVGTNPTEEKGGKKDPENRDLYVCV